MSEKKIEKGIVEVSSIKKELPISEENKSEVLQIAEEIRNLDKAVPPILSNFAKCQHCDLKEYCNKLR